MWFLPRSWREVTLLFAYCSLLTAGLLYVALLATSNDKLAPVIVLQLICVIFFAAIALGLKPKRSIWDHQRDLMRISSQRMPALPCITEGALMYYAITLEELAETGEAIAHVLDRRDPRRRLFDFDLLQTAHTLKSISQAMKSRVQRPFMLELERLDSKAILDGICDTTVTVAGLGISAGMPMETGYEVTAVSNYSKINPQTGVIDKDENGKWLKGPDYHVPNYDKVLDDALTSGIRLDNLA